MRYSTSELLSRALVTVLLLFVLEIISATVLTNMFSFRLRLSFAVLFCLFLSIYVQINFLPFLILIIQWVHSIFSFEGWALGSMIGIIFAVGLNYLKDIIHFGTYISQVIFIFISLSLWDIVRSLIIGIKLNSFEFLINHYLSDVVSNIILALASPYIFILLKVIWAENSQKALKA
ncbi:MAG: hypothetical protein H6621_04185 [Halobacteriovoraceae bacterium]|nr:hypothetical protein [Halobacteriovoraceae bacterium]